MLVEIVTLMFESVLGDDGKMMKRPNILNTRRWLKILIDRSLVIGTVDRLALHDIVGDFVTGQHSKEELRQAHRRLVGRSSARYAPQGCCHRCVFVCSLCAAACALSDRVLLLFRTTRVVQRGRLPEVLCRTHPARLGHRLGER